MSVVNRLRRGISLVAYWFSVIPPPLIAVSLVGVCMTAFLYDSRAAYLITPSIFLPGALHRGNRRQTLAAALLGAAVQTASVYSEKIDYSGPTFLSWLVPSLLSLLVLFLFEWRCRSDRTRRMLAWAVAQATALASVLAAVQLVIRCTGIGYWVPMLFNGNGKTYLRLDFFVVYPLEAALAWMLLSPKLALLLQNSNTATRFATGAVGLGILVFPITTQWGIYGFARSSLDGRGPFTTPAAVELLTIRGNADDLDLVWKTTVETPLWYEDELVVDLGIPRRNLGVAAVDWLLKRNKAWAESRVLALAKDPSHEFLFESDAVIDLIAERRAYEFVPQLLKIRSGQAVDALEQLLIPHTAVILLRQEWSKDFGETFDEYYSPWRPTATKKLLAPNRFPTPEVSEKTRHRLERLLGRDLGSDFDSWYEYYDEVAGPRSSMLGESTLAEADRIITGLRRLDSGILLRADLENRLVQRAAGKLMQQQGYQQDLEIIRRLSGDLEASRRPFLEIPPRTPEEIAFNRWTVAKQQVYRDIYEGLPELPNGALVGTSEFERALESFFRQVDEIEAKEFPENSATKAGLIDL